MKKILVTGATGFIGNYVIAAIVARKLHEVIATSANDRKGNRMLPGFDQVNIFRSI